MIYVAWWLFVFGVYPLAHPEHTGMAPMTVLDLTLHFVGGCIAVRHAAAWWAVNR